MQRNPEVPSMMYQSQTQAYNAQQQYSSKITDSTESTPPTFIPPNLSLASQQKRQVIHNLPSSCVHCGSPLTSQMISEVSGGTIMAYCKTPGACGRSQVLFVPPSFSKPKYEKVCIFLRNRNAQVKSGAELSLRADSCYFDGEFVESKEVCSRCEVVAHKHKLGYDKNGWLKVGEEQLELPKDWPIWVPGKSTWT